MRYTDPSGQTTTTSNGTFNIRGSNFNETSRFESSFPQFNLAPFNSSFSNTSFQNSSPNLNRRSTRNTRSVFPRFTGIFSPINIPFVAGFDQGNIPSQNLLGQGNHQQFITLPPKASEQALGPTACCDATDIPGISLKGVKFWLLGIVGLGKKGIAQRSIIEVTKAIAKRKAGFADTGTPIILDSNLEKRGLAEALRVASFNVRSVSEIFGKDPGDQAINKLANTIGARVLTRDRGAEIGEGFGSNAIKVDSRVRNINTIIRILSGGR